MKVSISAARQVARAALAELVAALQVEGADHRAHRARLRHGVDEPGPEQRNLEQEQELHVLVLEQLLAPRRTAAASSPRESRGRCRCLTSSASRSACGSGSEKRSGRKMLAVISSALRFQSRKVCGVLLGEARDIGERLLEIAAEDQRRAVEMRLAELVARRDVGDAVAEVQVLEPRRLADVEMIDRMQVVIEARRGHFLGRRARRRIAGADPPAGCRGRSCAR